MSMKFSTRDGFFFLALSIGLVLTLVESASSDSLILAQAQEPEPEQFVQEKSDEPLRFPNTYEKAVQRCNWIGVCEYKSFEDPKLHPFGPTPLAHYEVLKILKGADIGCDVTIKYRFTDIETPLPSGWRFSPSRMPKPGSQWILFCPLDYPNWKFTDTTTDGRKVNRNYYETYRGAYGRQKATEENIQRATKLIEQYKNNPPPMEHDE